MVNRELFLEIYLIFFTNSETYAQSLRNWESLSKFVNRDLFSGFKIRESLLYIGTDDNVLSVYNWKELNCKVIIKIPDAENGNFALMGKSLTVTVSKQKLPSKEDENCGSNDNSHVKRSEIKHLRFVDVGTKDTFRKPVSLKDFKIVTAASNGKLVLYKSLTNELVYQNI